MQQSLLMDGGSTFNLTTACPVWLLGLGCAIALAFAVWSYLRTWPPTKPGVRALLAVLRWGAIFGGLLVLAQPALELHRVVSEPAKLLVLVDKSASMTLTQDSLDRVEQVGRLLRGDSFGRLQRMFTTRLFSFADSLEDRWDDPGSLADEPPDGVGTDIGRAWIEALESAGLEPPSAIVIISDGVHNSGADPVRLARASLAPILAVGVGSPQPFRDLMVHSIAVSPVVYQGSQVPVEVGVRGVGASGRTATVAVRAPDGKTVGRRKVTFRSDFEEKTLVFDIEATMPGRQRFSVQVSALEGELTTDNNRRSVYLNVLASRMRVLLMAGPPDNALGDLVRRLRRDEHVQLTLRTTLRSRFYEGGWPDAALLAETDVVLLHHFPVRSNDRQRLESFAEAVIEAGLPVGFIDGGQVDSRLCRLFEPFLPVNVKAGPLRFSTGQVVPVRRHAVIADPDRTDFTQGWSGLPPVRFATGRFIPRPQAMVLAEFQQMAGAGGFPAIVVMEEGGVKSAALLGRDLWRWNLASPGDEGIPEPLLQRLIRWLAVRKVARQVEVTFDKELLSNQEPVGFTVAVQDENYQPIDGADVTVEVSRDGEVGGAAALEGIGGGRYRGLFRSWGEGEYTVQVRARMNEVVIGEDRGKVAVEPFSVELLDSRMNEELLRAMGEVSGGGFVPVVSADSLFDSFNFDPVDHEDVHRYEVWGRGWLLAVIVGLLACEWFIRIRVGML